MPVVNTVITIERPPAAVFAYITTPAFWPQWQPAVLSLQGVSERPLLLGEQVTVAYNVAGRMGAITWTVTCCRAPRHWTVAGPIAGQTNGGSVAYTLARRGPGTQLARTFTFDTYQPIARLQDALDLHRRVTAEAEAALAALKRVLEAAGA